MQKKVMRYRGESFYVFSAVVGFVSIFMVNYFSWL